MEPLIYEPAEGLDSAAGIEALQQDRRRWIEGLPRLVGIIGWDTSICRYLTAICSASGIKIPEQAAMISLETDDLLGRTMHPPLSGVDIPVKRNGYEAAGQLE